MAHTGKVREVRNRMLEIYGPNCWMGYKVSRKNNFTFHHIDEQRNGGKDEIDNGAILTYNAHQDLNKLDAHLKSLYHEFNELFIELNKTNRPPTIEYYKELHYLLQKARKYIDLEEKCMLKPNFDFDLLKEMIEKAREMGDIKGHLELVEEYYHGTIEKTSYLKSEGYIKIDGIYLPASFEHCEKEQVFESTSEMVEYTYNGYMQIKGVYMPVSYLITEPVRKQVSEKDKKVKRKIKTYDTVTINKEYRSNLRHKNRRIKEYKFN